MRNNPSPDFNNSVRPSATRPESALTLFVKILYLNDSLTLAALLIVRLGIAPATFAGISHL